MTDERHDDPTVIPVAGDDRLRRSSIGRGLLAGLARRTSAPGVRKVLIVHRADPRRRGRRAARAAASAATRCCSPRSRTPRRPSASRSPRSAGRSWARPTSPARTPSSASAGARSTDLAGFVAATWLRGVRPHPGADHRARHGRRGRRRQDRHQHRRGQEPRRRVLRARRGALRPRHCSTRCRSNEILAGFAEIVKAGFIAEPEILDIIEADVDARDRSRDAEFRRRGRAGDRDEGARRRRGLHRAGPARDPELRAHARPRDRARRALPVAPRRRRRRSAWCSPPSSSRLTGSLSDEAVDRHRRILELADAADQLPGSAAGRRCWPPCSATRRRAASCCASSCSTTSARPTRAHGPGRAPAVRRLPGDRRRDGTAPTGMRRTASASCSDSASRVLVLNGPNLGRLGSREPDVYGIRRPRRAARRCSRPRRPARHAIDLRQTDDEAELIALAARGRRHRHARHPQPGRFTHYSYALRDAAALVTKAGHRR